MTLPAWRDPEQVFLALTPNEARVAWLDGGVDAVTGRSLIAIAEPDAPVVIASGADEPDAVYAELAARLAPVVADERGADAGSTVLGWFGWFAYEFGARTLGVPTAPTDTPQAAFFFARRAILFEHGTRTVRLEWLDDGADAASVDWAERTAAAIAGLDAEYDGAGEHAEGASAPTSEPPVTRWRHDAHAYGEMIAACQAAIVRGDAYQLCLTNRVDIDVHPDPAETYLALRASSPSHHGGYVRFGNIALLSASPEQFLHVDPDGIVSTKPMKGTRPRSADPDLDARLRRELLESEKERAENLMIVDLMRNDLGRIAELGTVTVPSLLEVEEYAHVHQLVSTVRARIRHPLTALDVVRAAFPAGSMTGAPKHSAMTILHELEDGPRGVYSGAFGYLGVDGSADLAMVIRSIVLTPRGASIGTGGGITALSVAEEEIEETRVKARALLEVLGAASVALG